MEDDIFFKIEQHTTRPLYEDRRLAMIRYEMNLHKTVGERVVYSMLDLLGDVGGMIEALAYISMILLFMITYKPVDRTLIKQLFKYKDEPPDTKKEDKSDGKKKKAS